MQSDKPVDADDGVGDDRRSHGHGWVDAGGAAAGGGVDDGPVQRQYQKHYANDGADDHGCSGEGPVADADADAVGVGDGTPSVVRQRPGELESERLTLSCRFRC